MDIRPIRTEEDYEAALEEIDRLFNSEPGTPEGDKMEVLSILVNVYEEEHYAIPLPDPIEAIEYHMERLGLTRRDMEPFIGGPSRISEILNRKRKLTMEMIRRLSDGLNIPIEILAQQYELEEMAEPTGYESFPRRSTATPYSLYANYPVVTETFTPEELSLSKMASNYVSDVDALEAWRGSGDVVH